MEKKHIPAKDCLEGWILAQPIFNEYGTVIVMENTTINSYIKSRLMEFGVERIWVYAPDGRKSHQDESSTYEQFQNKYKSNVMAIKDVINDLAAGKKLEMEKISDVSNSLYSELNNTGYVTRCLNEIKDSDEYTYSHCINVALYTMLAAKWLKLSEQEIKEAIHAGLLHDIGKSKVPLDILNKPSRLSSEEFEEIKKHTVYGYEIVKSIDHISENVRQAVLMHHEREDNTGYPTGAKGGEINIYSKIVAVTDVFDAMTSDRVYKKRATPFEAFEMFHSEGLTSFDTRVSLTFLSNLSVNYIGAKVMLNTGESGEVAYIPPHNITKPVVSLKSKYIDMSKEKSIKIESIIK
ncbi:MAG: HD-GYP domain-containing protein [Clostridia bacterium]|nr:HD-GYP domain-containing protein [Clostridia bacterium]